MMKRRKHEKGKKIEHKQWKREERGEQKNETGMVVRERKEEKGKMRKKM